MVCFPIMGQKESVLPDEKIREYELFTYLSEEEIKKAFERFSKFQPDVDCQSFNPAISVERLDELPIFKVNPFKDRLIELFINPSSRCLTFEDYLDLVSVFNKKAPILLKAEYAFKIYDFDGDDLLSRNDLKEILSRLEVHESNTLKTCDINEILNSVMNDGDIDEDGFITFTEFFHLVQRLADFVSTFIIRL